MRQFRSRQGGGEVRHQKASVLLDLARALAASAEGLTLDEMATQASIGRRTAERMRDALEQLFPQMEMLPEGTIKRYRIPGGLDSFYQSPTTEELLELAKAAAHLRANGQASRAEAIERLDHKVRSAVKSAALRRLTPDIDALARAEMSVARAGPRPIDRPDELAVIRRAIMAMCAVRFRYQGGSTPGRWRTVTPYGLLFERMNYLVGAEIGAEGAPRNWRLDRIVDLELTTVVASAPEGFDLGDYASRSFGVYQDAVEEVVLRVLPHGLADVQIWRFHLDQTFAQEADGSTIVRFRSGGMLELAWHLFTWGDKIEILAPERLKRTMLDALQVAIARHAISATETVVIVE